MNYKDYMVWPLHTYPTSSPTLLPRVPYSSATLGTWNMPISSLPYGFDTCFSLCLECSSSWASQGWLLLGNQISVQISALQSSPMATLSKSGPPAIISSFCFIFWPLITIWNLFFVCLRSPSTRIQVPWERKRVHRSLLHPRMWNRTWHKISAQVMSVEWSIMVKNVTKQESLHT